LNYYSDKSLDNLFIGEKEWKKLFYPYIKSNNFSQFESLFPKSYFKERIIEYNDWILIWQSLVRVNYEQAYETFLYIGNNTNISNFVNYYPKDKFDYYQALKHKALKICVLAENPENLVIIII